MSGESLSTARAKGNGVRVQLLDVDPAEDEDADLYYKKGAG